MRLRRDRGFDLKARPSSFKTIPASICAPRGFKAAAVFCDIKRLGTGKGSEKGRKDDLALIVSDTPAAVAGMFTTNQVCAAPVKVSARNVARKFARAIVVNSGNANACTGARGLKDAEDMTRVAAQAVAAVYDRRNGKQKTDSAVIDRRYRKIAAREFLVASTGRIGVPMPMANVKRGIVEAAERLTRSRAAARDAAEAIMTSDTRRKEIAVEFQLGDARVRIGGICKGAGMIQPGMSRTGKGPAAGLHATMLAFLTTDAAVQAGYLKEALERAVAQSFNRITVDGDMSTNDTVLILANGAAGNAPGSLRTAKRLQKNEASRDAATFQGALDFVTLELAKMIVRDGEGVTRFITLHVCGARSAADAEAVARAVANSTLVKTSWFGGDPNWGRILCAMGYSSARVDETKVDVGYSRPKGNKITYAVRRGQPTRVGLQTLGAIVSRPEFDLHIFLNSGRHGCVLYTSDLTEKYVEFNKGNLSDPASLGG
ncbi:MAG TPA: bifunctional glutamate N-acetyltransferase/amino-acid acetyltransferase ArgJ [Chthoniobacterales bacterium]|nr:bifunctional glutamate N-acetyltransferase/amino-acid acetyltransferase ArgJ [Chthoniobacterales bacterium]